MIWAFVLLLVGLVLVLAEVFFPSLGLIGILAAAAILGADAIAYREGGGGALAGFIAFEVIAIPVLVSFALKWLPNLPFGRKMILSGPTSAPGTGAPDFKALVGARGVALTEVAPSGIMQVGEARVSVVSTGPSLPSGAKLLVVGVDGPEVRVELATDANASDPMPEPPASAETEA